MLTLSSLGSTTVLTPTLTLPGTGDRMPAIGYGTWLSAAGEVYEGTKEALKSGYRHIDEAWVYMNEAEVGAAVADALTEGTLGSRDELWLTSKLWNNFHRPELVREGAIDTLTKLGVEQLDLFLIHFPVSFTPGTVEATSADQVEKVPLSETWGAMEALVEEGLVRNIGVSNFEIPELKMVQEVATKPIACNQVGQTGGFGTGLDLAGVGWVGWDGLGWVGRLGRGGLGWD